jgi:hypothetical protein
MSTLAEIPELVGFFSYSREDDEGSGGRLSKLREQIQEELRAQLGRTKKDSDCGKTSTQYRTASCGRKVSKMLLMNRHFSFRWLPPPPSGAITANLISTRFWNEKNSSLAITSYFPFFTFLFRR